MKQAKLVLSLTALLLSSNAAQAASMPSNTVMYISPTHYSHSVRLLHPYYNYWFAQGPIVEPIALKALQTKNTQLSVCQTGEKAETVVRISPRIFYNPQMRVYYSEMHAVVYSGGGSQLGTYTGEAQQLGFNSVDVGLEGHIQQVYASAMADLMTKIDITKDAAHDTEVKLPCNIVGGQFAQNIHYY